MAGRARILVVDDDNSIAASLRRMLIYEGYEVDVASDGASGLRLAADRLPALVILDVMLPGLDGMEVCRRLRAAGDIAILMLTARDATGDRVRGLDSGADDYLAKPFASEELVARVRALLRRAAPGRIAPLRFADLEVDAGSREVWRRGRALDLTAKEFDLLHQFVLHPRQVLTRDRLLERVWGLGSAVESNVVDVYIGYLRHKLEEAGEPRLLQTIRGVGYALREP